MESANQAVAAGLEKQARGDLAGAEALYREALARVPDHAAATHCLGLVAAQGGRLDEAVEFLRKSVALDPGNASFHANLGAVLAGDGRWAEAAAAAREATRLNPGLADAQANLGTALRRLGQPGDAAEAFRAAVAADPQHAEAHAALGSALLALGRPEEAVLACQAAVRLKPDQAAFQAGLANAFKEAGRPEEAAEACRAAIGLQPDSAVLHNNHGVLLRQLGRFAAAADCYRRALALEPDFAEAHNNLGRVLRDLGKLPESIESCRRAIALRPDFAAAHDNLGISLLLAGELEEGGVEYEWRLQLRPLPALAADPPVWRGEDLQGRRLLVRGEQGIGDQIMFAGLLPDLLDRGPRCILEAEPRLEPLIRRSFPEIAFVPQQDPPAAMLAENRIDLQVAIGSLPHRLRPRGEAPATRRPYLKADMNAARGLRARYREHFPGRLIVGLAWRGGKPLAARFRSVPLEQMGPLLAMPEAAFVSLQYGDHASEIAEAERRCKVRILHDPDVDALASMDDLAAQIMATDLVISVDSAVVHLAGALGAPVWVLLPKVPDWRWLLDGATSRWYASARLFRQTNQGEWGDVVARLARELGDHAAAARLRGSGSGMAPPSPAPSVATRA